MKKLRGILEALIWLLFTVPVAAGGTVYYIESVSSYTQADVAAVLLWCSIMLILTGLAAFLFTWTKQKPGILCLGKGASVALEVICCLILVSAGIYFRIGQEFVAFWSEQDGNPVVEAALVKLDRTSVSQTDLVTAAYVFLLNRLFWLVGNLSLAAAGMQLVIFAAGSILLYFLVRRCYGAFAAVICLEGLMLLPQMVRSSMYCSPEILLFLSAVILGWILHLCLDRRLKKEWKALPDFLVLALYTAGCVYVDWADWSSMAGETFLDRALTVSGQTALVLGILCAVLYLFLESRETVAVYMLMTVFLIAVQMLGLADSVGCMAALAVVVSVLLGLSLDGLLFYDEAAPETAMMPGENTSGLSEEHVSETAEVSVESTATASGKDTPEKTEVSGEAEAAPGEENVQTATAAADEKTEPERQKEDMQLSEEEVKEEDMQLPEPEAKEEDIHLPESEAIPEIYIPETMEIPKRKKRAKIDFDREFSEDEMSFDLEVEDGEEFDR